MTATQTTEHRIVRTGPLVVDLGLRSAYVDGREVILPRLRWELLALLSQQPGRWVWPHEVRAALWDGIAPESAVSTLVSRLRQRLGPAGVLIESRCMTGGGMRLRLEPES